MCGNCDANAQVETKHFVKYWCKYAFIRDDYTMRNVGIAKTNEV